MLFFTGHFGFWELHALVHALRLEPFSVIARPLDNPFLNALLEQIRQRTRERASACDAQGTDAVLIPTSRDAVTLRAAATAIPRCARAIQRIARPRLPQSTSDSRRAAIAATRVRSNAPAMPR